MSILIKGMEMEMPRNCWECEFNKSTLDRMDFCTLTNKQYNWGLSERPSDCPLIEVPPHGRLGDLDKLEQMFVDIDNAPYSGFDGEEPFYSAEDAALIIRLTPTVIPADKDGEA